MRMLVPRQSSEVQCTSCRQFGLAYIWPYKVDLRNQDLLRGVATEQTQLIYYGTQQGDRFSGLLFCAFERDTL